LNVPSWSISCEWFFYLLAPVAMFLVLGKSRHWVPVVVAIGYACGLGFFL
jgi:peptidoglycan/LPS O-acetylase OafA/YrhL